VSADERPRVVEPDLAPEEKETIIRFSKRDDRAHIFSEQRGVVGRLLRHPEADVGRVTLADGSRVENPDVLDGTDTVVGIEATVPVGTLKVQETPRKAGGLAAVVSDGGERK
jgi:hypothetical protein